ncbi:winged helix-turn-helix domain-containing protein [Sphingomonas mesophila]|uniref:winged helix-turn-helix domain-containing protein n=1 Tax=Sphingomonas mesophila TaxID=2303576 RepID=UPI000E593CFF|nr:winged helix-turn-helix domain-containing protein [Sphingomonas mesophila]
MADGIRFSDFTLDAGDRQLRRDGAPVELSSRYFDALALLVAERGRLVTKDRFLGEVWRGVPVTDEALTQCIRTLRRQLGDDAARPRFIETVPKHGYRFIAEVEDGAAASQPPTPNVARPRVPLNLFVAGIAGSAVAGLLGGLVYGFAASSGMGALSVLLVMVALTVAVAIAGGAGVSAGIAAARSRRSGEWWATVALAALGGMIVGALVKLIAIDAFNLLFGHSPLGITGGIEGAVLGAAVGLAAWLALRPGADRRLRSKVAVAGALGAAAGLGIVALGGRLLGGSLDLLGHEYDGSRLKLTQFGALLGEDGFGRVSQLVSGALEGGLFAGCLVGAMVLAVGREPTT